MSGAAARFRTAPAGAAHTYIPTLRSSATKQRILSSCRQPTTLMSRVVCVGRGHSIIAETHSGSGV
eukprot:6419273-Prymnesium_polylepis.1